MSDSNLLTKQEAADLLEVSTRQIENYAKERKLSVEYGSNGRGRSAFFRRDEIETLKNRRDQINSSKAALYTAPPSPSAAPETENLPAIPDANYSGQTVAALVQFLSQQTAQAAQIGSIKPAVSVAEKLLLTIDEAQALTGLSRDVLREAIKTENLKAQIIGRGFRIKRADLEKYIKNL